MSEVLSDVVRLHALNRIQAEAAWLMAEEMLPVSAGKAVPDLIRCETDQNQEPEFCFVCSGMTAAKAAPIKDGCRAPTTAACTLHLDLGTPQDADRVSAKHASKQDQIWVLCSATCMLSRSLRTFLSTTNRVRQRD